MMKILSLSMLVSVLGLFVGLAGVNAQAILTAIEDQSIAVEDVPQPDASEEAFVLLPFEEANVTVSEVQGIPYETERFQKMNHKPLASDPRHGFSDPCPACGMG